MGEDNLSTSHSNLQRSKSLHCMVRIIIKSLIANWSAYVTGQWTYYTLFVMRLWKKCVVWGCDTFCANCPLCYHPTCHQSVTMSWGCHENVTRMLIVMSHYSVCSSLFVQYFVHPIKRQGSLVSAWVMLIRPQHQQAVTFWHDRVALIKKWKDTASKLNQFYFGAIWFWLIYKNKRKQCYSVDLRGDNHSIWFHCWVFILLRYNSHEIMSRLRRQISLMEYFVMIINILWIECRQSGRLLYLFRILHCHQPASILCKPAGVCQMVPRNNVCSCSLDTENVIDTDDFTRDKNVNEFT